MVMRADVAAAAIDAVRDGERPLIYLSPRGAPLTQGRVKALAAGPGAILFCGRFEGLDQRAIEARSLEEISLGDFVLGGGEIAAAALIEAAVRLLPGVLGAEGSKAEESFEEGLLEYPHYTRPQSFEGREIPPVLSSGNHAEIARWRKAEAEALTKARRGDLWTHYEKQRRSAIGPASGPKTGKKPPPRSVS
jgi:tRNA (guanine37-N1)-methyltransferase